jgi:GntR family transcriptional regulator/MocR family aminotransferase
MPYRLHERPQLPPHRVESERAALLRSSGDFNLWELDRRDRNPLVRQIYARLRTAILAGTLQAGTRLPSTRDMAASLRVARSTVIAAYEQLAIEGYIVGRVGSGTCVSIDLPDQTAVQTSKQIPDGARAASKRHIADSIEALVREKAPDAMPFTLGRCRFEQRSNDVWRGIVRRSLQDVAPTHLGYSDPRGLPELRELVCEHLRTMRAVRCEPWQIIITTGTQQAIDITIRALLSQGDQVWVEDPGYPMTYSALKAAKAAIHPIAIDPQGIKVADGIQIAPRARAAFVTPSHQNPLGVILSMARRLEILDWASSSGAYIIEDDYDSDFRYDAQPIASLQGLDEYERVIYVGTFNKILFPGLRLGFLVVPSGLVRDFIATRHIIDRHPQSLLQPVLSEFMRGGHFAAHVRRTRQQYREQRDVLVAELSQHLSTWIEVESPGQGMHLVAYLRQGLPDLEVERVARQEGVIVRPMSPLYHLAPQRQALVLGFSGYSREAIPPAVTRLSHALRHLGKRP